MSRRGRQQNFNESIYNLVPKPQPKPQPRKRHVSKFPHDTAPTASTFGPSAGSACMTTNMSGDYAIDPTSHAHKRGGATFGKQKDHYADPTTFLKKSTKGSLQDPTAFKYQDTIKPPVVRGTERPTMGRRSNANFVRENQMAAIMSEPKKKGVDQIKYAQKSDFGKVPAYLSSVKAEIAAEQDYIQGEMERQRQMYERPQDKMELLAEPERLELLNKLKKNWEITNQQYQKHTHVVTLDTVGKIRRKEDYESQLQQFEQAIEKLSKKFVFVQVANEYANYY